MPGLEASPLCLARRATAFPLVLDAQTTAHACWCGMQSVQISPGKALCRFCGEQVSMNRLSTHIAKEHPRPGQIDMSPRLVRGRPAAKEPRSNTQPRGRRR